MCLLMAFVNSMNTGMLYVIKMLVDGLQTAARDDLWATLQIPFALLAGTCLVHIICYRLINIIDAHTMPMMQNRLRDTLFAHALDHSHDYFHNRFAGELAAKIGNVNRSWHSLLWARLLHGFIPTTFAVLTSAVLLWRIDHALVFILFGTVLALTLLSFVCGPVIAKTSAKLADSESEITGQLVDTFSNVSSVKNFDRFKHEFGLLSALQKVYSRDYRRNSIAQQWFWGLFDLAITLLLLGFVWRLITSHGAGQANLGDTAMTMTIGWDLWWRLSFLSWNLLELSGDKGRLQEALAEIVQPHEITDTSNAPALAVTKGEITFKNVAFTHKSGHKVFENLNLTIRAAEKVGLVGLSGAGKTTLAQLVLRNYDIQGGQILIDGQDIAATSQSSLKKAIAVIPQDPSLFHRTLKENVLYGRPDATEDEVIAATRAAQAHSFIEKLKEGYDTLVGERGVKLSGGQRQRISIARAILKNAPILILDEATSALDSQTERLIQSALTTAMEGRTTVVIAHRLSTLVHLDRLIVLKGGRVEEEGTLTELLGKNGHFAELWRCQADGFLPEKIPENPLESP